MFEDEDDTPVSKFYRNRSVFITGATGFVGKVLLEKLLRSCRGIRNVYVLMRKKKEKSPEQRFEELMNSKVFDRVKNEYPEAIRKVVMVTGDILLPSLGLSESATATITENISIVFHSAATVSFAEPLKQAVDMNVLGTRRVLELCHRSQKIEALIHVSTAYSNCNRKDIEEVIYPPVVPYQLLIDMTACLEPDVIETITPKITGDGPNTYTVTKALAENLLDEEHGTLPVAIIRPSIVAATWKEPCPGWVDNLNGASAIVNAGGKGFLRTFIADGEATADIIPVDVVANLIITVAWYTADHRPDRVMVYNCTSGRLNKTTWSQVLDYSYENILKYPSAQIFRYPLLKYTRSRLCHYFQAAFQHFLIAILFDTALRLFFKKPRMIRLYQKIHKLADCLEYFTTHDWDFHCDNVLMINDLLSKEDKQKFYIDVRTLNWNSLWENYVLGLRKFCLKEDPSTIQAARKNLKMRYILSQVPKIVLAIVVWKFFFPNFF